MDNDTDKTEPIESVRNSVLQLSRALASVEPGELSKAFSSDGELSEKTLEAFPGLVNATVAALDGLLGYLDSLPDEEAAGIVESSVSGIDGRSLGRTANSYFRLLIDIYGNDPGFLVDRRLDIADGFVESLDFGKLRKAVTLKMRADGELLGREIEMLAGEPLGVINLFNLVPEYLNTRLRVLDTLFRQLSLPREAMSYALFQILRDIDWKTAASSLNGALGLIDSLHRGSLLLGEGSPEFRQVAGDILEDFLSAVDWEAARRAAEAVGANMEVFISAATGSILCREDRMLAAADIAAVLSNSAVRSYSEILKKLCAVPPDEFARLSEKLCSGLDGRELGTAFGLYVELLDRASRETPANVRSFWEDFLSSVDGERTAAAFGRALALLVRGARGAGTGETEDNSGGRIVSGFISGYRGTSGEEHGPVTLVMEGIASRIDERELQSSVRNASVGLARVLARRPGLLKSFLLGIAAGAKEYLKRRLESRTGRYRSGGGS